MAKNLYNVTNITTGEVWEKLTAEEIGKRIGLTEGTVRQYACNYGGFRQYKFERAYVVKQCCNAAPVALLREWDKYVPKLNRKVKELGLNIQVVRGQ